MKKLNLKTIISIFIIPIVCLSSSAFIFFNNQNDSYKLMFLLPMCYLFCYELLLKNSFVYLKEFSISYTIVSFGRYILTPILIILGNRYDGRSPLFPNLTSFNHAFLIMCYELLICSLFIKIADVNLSKKYKSIINNEKSYIFPKRIIVYLLFLALVLSAIAFNPSIIRVFSFITPNENAFNYSDFTTINQIIVLLALVAKNIVFLLLMFFLKKKYDKNNKFIYIILSFVIVVVNSMVYFGTNRFDFILNLVANTILFGLFYKKQFKMVIIIMSVVSFSIFNLITQVRNIRTLNYGDNKFFDIADKFQMYLGGPYNVAISLETAHMFPEGRNIETLAYDFTRSTLGLNVIIRNINGVNLSSYYFNKRIFFNEHSSQIIPMIGEGYYFFGAIFSPTIDIVFVYIAYILKKYQLKNNQIEIFYFFIITFIRLGFINCQSATIQMNDLSFNLFLPLILIFLNTRINLRGKEK